MNSAAYFQQVTVLSVADATTSIAIAVGATVGVLLIIGVVVVVLLLLYKKRFGYFP